MGIHIPCHIIPNHATAIQLIPNLKPSYTYSIDYWSLAATVLLMIDKLPYTKKARLCND